MTQTHGCYAFPWQITAIKSVVFRIFMRIRVLPIRSSWSAQTEISVGTLRCSSANLLFYSFAKTDVSQNRCHVSWQVGHLLLCGFVLRMSFWLSCYNSLKFYRLQTRLKDSFTRFFLLGLLIEWHTSYIVYFLEYLTKGII